MFVMVTLGAADGKLWTISGTQFVHFKRAKITKSRYLKAKSSTNFCIFYSDFLTYPKKL
jgi:hypothetical protein